MSQSEANIVLAAGALSVVGVAAALMATTLARRVADLVGLAGGLVILLVVLVDLGPEALSGSPVERWFLAGGALLGVLTELLMRWRGRDAPGSTPAVAAWVGLGVLALHSTLDGAVYTAIFWSQEDTAQFASLGLILHEAPEGVVAMALALQAGLRPPVAATAAILASSMTTPLGWVIAHAIGEGARPVMQAMLAASAGLLLYVGWHLVAGGWRALRSSR